MEDTSGELKHFNDFVFLLKGDFQLSFCNGIKQIGCKSFKLTSISVVVFQRNTLACGITKPTDAHMAVLKSHNT
jgi:hypothetical protein